MPKYTLLELFLKQKVVISLQTSIHILFKELYAQAYFELSSCWP